LKALGDLQRRRNMGEGTAARRSCGLPCGTDWGFMQGFRAGYSTHLGHGSVPGPHASDAYYQNSIFRDALVFGGKSSPKSGPCLPCSFMEVGIDDGNRQGAATASGTLLLTASMHRSTRRGTAGAKKQCFIPHAPLCRARFDAYRDPAASRRSARPRFGMMGEGVPP